jgi:hypothetical protein
MWRKGEVFSSMFSFSSLALEIFSFTSWTQFPTNSIADKKGSRAKFLGEKRIVGAMLFLRNLATLPK